MSEDLTAAMVLTIDDTDGQNILEIKVLGTGDLEDWLQADVLFDYTGFTAKFRIHLMLNSFHSFQDQLINLNDSLSGEAVFVTIEDNVSLSFIIDDLGHIKIEGVLTHPLNYDLKMLFTVFSDQTFLAKMIADCNKILRQDQ